MPGAFDQAVADADTFFAQELPAIQQWRFGAAEGARIKQPVLLVMGGKSHEVSPVWQQRQSLLTAWLSNVEPFVLDGATHMLHLQNTRGLAERLARFVADHPAESKRNRSQHAALLISVFIPGSRVVLMSEWRRLARP